MMFSFAQASMYMRHKIRLQSHVDANLSGVFPSKSFRR
eukprot:CAMPEP_0206283440 /NCGR_PEP_ID=MMETSP0047_2-20121206/40226_1 /ASSEMBLY_ACC=CAM_ASM_000192 /TAXON_ID=195065 /ORGANISM="Chroomonas mesostigmatica_cf, Strain CCMP1168" /LENGTH=37 /DNA_ID= /DNA_START= /DNA_END= /DNA_ORIENTATION=